MDSHFAKGFTSQRLVRMEQKNSCLKIKNIMDLVRCVTEPRSNALAGLALFILGTPVESVHEHADKRSLRVDIGDNARHLEWVFNL